MLGGATTCGELIWGECPSAVVSFLSSREHADDKVVIIFLSTHQGFHRFCPVRTRLPTITQADAEYIDQQVYLFFGVCDGPNCHT